MSSSSPSSSPDVRRKHKHHRRSRSRSHSPGDNNRYSVKVKKEPRDYESRRGEKKHKRKHRDHRDRYSESPEPRRIKEEPEDNLPSRYRTTRNDSEERDPPRRIKDEPDDRDVRRRERHIKREPQNDDYDDNRRDQMQSRRENDAKRRKKRRWQQDQENESEFNFGGPSSQDNEGEEGEAPVEKEKPNFEVSGKLAEETNMFRGVVIKYSEPPEARKPKKRWRLYPFKDGESMPVLHIHRQSAFLMGRDRKIADIPIDHPSCSKQHCVLQYRFVPFTKPDGRRGHVVRPYIIDLGSTNGTHVNNQRIEAQRYVELKEQDVVKFGFSSREYVLLHDKSKTDEAEDQGEPN